MKKHIYILAGVIVLGAAVLLSCKKKQDDGSTKPDYKEVAGTGSNPQPNNVTVTGSVSTNTPPTQDSYFTVGTAGWSNLSCVTTNFLYLQASNGDTKVTLTFASPPPIGTSTYAIASVPGAGSVAFQIQNAPDQPANIVWIGRTGAISVNTSTSAVNAMITQNIMCYQSSGFNFPHVTVSGNLGCN
jgi:hypothetical protein